MWLHPHDSPHARSIFDATGSLTHRAEIGRDAAASSNQNSRPVPHVCARVYASADRAATRCSTALKLSNPAFEPDAQLFINVYLAALTLCSERSRAGRGSLPGCRPFLALPGPGGYAIQKRSEDRPSRNLQKQLGHVRNTSETGEGLCCCCHRPALCASHARNNWEEDGPGRLAPAPSRQAWNTTTPLQLKRGVAATRSPLPGCWKTRLEAIKRRVVAGSLSFALPLVLVSSGLPQQLCLGCRSPLAC
jgi:hypothetical protein